jgi:hypothetical protein
MNNFRLKTIKTRDDVKARVEAIYRNYGIDPDDMEDEEITRVTNYYVNGKADLNGDYIKSLRHKEKLCETDGNLDND